MSGDSTGAWSLADALVAELPGRESGQAMTGNGSDATTVSLAAIADRLTEDGIETPAGGTYSSPVFGGGPELLAGVV
jgi:hypothetical protein